MLGVDAEERRSGLYASRVAVFRSRGPVRCNLVTAWVLLKKSHGGQSEAGWDVSFLDALGHELAQMKGFAMSSLHTVSADFWEPCKVSPALVQNAVTIRPHSVQELHTAVLEWIEARPARLCVLAEDEEVAAYVRALRQEYPAWKVTCVVGKDEPEGVPADSEEEWAWRDEKWAVRRMKW
eukprot:1972541-Rhodomonas_salina.1